ncbi:hypothetical protein BN1051_02106 [Arthrobacter saudimassiliensis]|uniref:Putative zinc-finger domain-containing protein n=1 Tax=Arthrobacter saudimassiliensis TaxID=1461584 RepID=A0A078MND5_9MICC|nr:hypothetical protein BN1051_02106 [Arthrobacter saudimassiliensis]
MRHPTRDLRAFVDDGLPDGRRRAVSRHLEQCPSCRAEVAEERRLRSRLRALKVPSPAAGLSEGLPLAAPEAQPRQAAVTARGALVVAAGLGLAGAAVIGGAYAVGNNVGDVAEGQRAGLTAGWAQASTQDELGPEGLQALRASGWTCPELEGLDLELVSAKAVEVAGQPAVELELEGRGERITVYEQRPGARGAGDEAAVNAVSGRAVGEDGFVPDPDSVGAQVWEHPEQPGLVVLASSNVTYTLKSSLPVRSLPEAVQELSLTESARLVPASGADQDALVRILRGLRLFSEPGAP